MASLDSLEIPKLRSLDAAVAWRARLAAEGRRLVMTNGCFDLLHAGHLYFLQEAARLGDALLVALNSDASVKSLKGPGRPVQSQRERALALSALECVASVVVFSEPRLVREIALLKPDIYTKAGDYSLDQLDPSERASLRVVRAEIKFLPFLEGFSSSDLINRIAAAGGSA